MLLLILEIDDFKLDLASSHLALALLCFQSFSKGMHAHTHPHTDSGIGISQLYETSSTSTNVQY